MPYIPKKTLEDLEFFEVLNQISKHAKTLIGNEQCQNIRPLDQNDEELLSSLYHVSEYRSSFDNENTIPDHFFKDFSKCFRLLEVENSVLPIESFSDISLASETVNNLLSFFKKFKTYYPKIFLIGEEIELNKDIKKTISNIIDRFGEIRNNASEKLKLLRNKIQSIQKEIGQSFEETLKKLNKLDYLDGIRESVIDNKRVLAVKSMHRKKIKGRIAGSSKTGSIVFIEPETTFELSNVLQNLYFEESEEIRRILMDLTDYLRPKLELIKSYHFYLIKIDTIYARAKYALEINGILPEFSDKSELNLINAYHPLLYIENKKGNKTTFPQDIKLSDKKRIVIISGPNAGGKSITLKTLGLLQIMIQSGILIPVDANSKLCFFKKILTDIGDNQSIENQLSTYSYRIKKMKEFIKKCDQETLFLIDEFGTGSDPELGGALAEAILEVFYDKKSLGLITTHYTNLKLLANELDCMENANMQFNEDTFEPVFNLITGEAGSSFTFEVAQKNGLPYSIINKAKKKLEKDKVRFETTISKLQKERSKIVKTESSLKKKEAEKQKESELLENLNIKIKKKLIDYQELLNNDKKIIELGNKVNDIAEVYFHNNKKRPMVAKLLELIEKENSKRKRKSVEIIKKEKKNKKRASVEIQSDIKQLKKEIIDPIESPKKKKLILKVGDKVRLPDSVSVGSIDSIEKNKAIVNYGTFTTQVNIDKLEPA
tara:strand:- start:9384 stop:11531 length:2148 start_codon:yes stop_codon:yes gene_type:complete